MLSEGVQIMQVNFNCFGFVPYLYIELLSQLSVKSVSVLEIG